MDLGATVTIALLAVWAAVLCCVAAGAVLYHWPADFDGHTRRGFDVLPPQGPADPSMFRRSAAAQYEKKNDAFPPCVSNSSLKSPW